MPKKNEARPSSDDPSFEQALEKLESIVHELEEGRTPLGQSLEAYERGVKLLRRCYDLLDRAEQRIERLSGVDSHGQPISEPLEDEAGQSLEEKGHARPRRRSARGSSSAEGGLDDPGDSDMDGGATLF